MPDIVAAFSGFSVKDLNAAKEFYTNILGLDVAEDMGLQISLPGGGKVFVYEKPDHVPASFTILNLVVEAIDIAVDDLVAKGVKFEQYDMPEIKQDEKGIARGRDTNMGPDIAWFTDPSGNIIAVLQN